MTRSRNSGSNVHRGSFGLDLTARRSVNIDLPEFLVRALEARVAEANDGAAPEERCSLDELIESELVNVVTLRDVAELDIQLPGFAEAVHQWLLETRQ